MGNQKYITSFLLIIIFVLLGFTTYLLFQKEKAAPVATIEEIKKEQEQAKQPSYISLEDLVIPEITERSAAQPEVYLGSNISIPKNIGCIDIGQYGDSKKPGQEELIADLTEEEHIIFDPYTLNGWMFQQACKADDYTFAYSLYNKDRSDKYLSNNMMVSFVEDKVSLSYYKDEKINKPSTGSEICNIYKVTTTFLEYSCNTNDGVKKWQLPFDQKRTVTPLN